MASSPKAYECYDLSNLKLFTYDIILDLRSISRLENVEKDDMDHKLHLNYRYEVSAFIHFVFAS